MDPLGLVERSSLCQLREERLRGQQGCDVPPSRRIGHVAQALTNDLSCRRVTSDHNAGEKWENTCCNKL